MDDLDSANTSIKADKASLEFELSLFRNSLLSDEGFDNLISELFDKVAIFNDYRQFIYASEPFLNSIGRSRLETIGTRFGDGLQCINARGEGVSCGESEHCLDCPALQAQLNALSTCRKNSTDCSILNCDDVQFHWKLEFIPYNIGSRVFLVCKVNSL